jgi:excisionase family DNA binding protein
MAKESDSIMTIEEVAAYLKIPKSTVYTLAQEGKMPRQKVGRQWRFHKEAIDNWIREGKS